MKRKIFSVLLALVLVLSFSLVTAVPVAANGTTYEALFTSYDQTLDGRFTMPGGYIYNGGPSSGGTDGAYDFGLSSGPDYTGWDTDHTGVGAYDDPSRGWFYEQNNGGWTDAYSSTEDTDSGYVEFEWTFSNVATSEGYMLTVTVCDLDDYIAKKGEDWANVPDEWGVYVNDSYIGDLYAYDDTGGTDDPERSINVFNVGDVSGSVKIEINGTYFDLLHDPNYYGTDYGDYASWGDTASAQHGIRLEGLRLAPVVNADTGEGFSSIQAAITVASDGDTINVAAGTYIEPQLSINKSLTIQGAGQNDVIIKRSGGEGSYFLSVSGAIDFTMKDLTIDASGSATTNFVAHISGLTSTTFENVTVIGQGKDYTTDGQPYSYVDPTNNNIVGGLDLIDVDRASLINVTVSNVSRNGFSFTNVNTISLTGFTASNCGHKDSTGWAGVAVYRNVDGASSLRLYGINSISNASIGINAHIISGTVWPKAYTSSPFNLSISDVLVPVVAPNTSSSDTFALEVIPSIPYKVYATSGPSVGFASYFFNTDDAIAAALDAFTLFTVEHVVYDLATPKFIVGAGMSIQSAVVAAIDGDTIVVAAGTYDEQVEIGKSLTLLGAQADVPIVNGDRAGEESIISGTLTSLCVVTITHSDVIVNGFTIEKAKMWNMWISGPAGGKISNICVSYNYIEESGKDGIFRDSAAADVTIDHNYIASNSRGIATNGGATTITDNTFYGNGQGIAFNGGDPFSLYFPDYEEPIYPTIISGNSFTDDSTSMYLRLDKCHQSITITGNDITGARNDAIRTWNTYNVDIVNPAIHFNNIVGSTNFGINNTVEGIILDAKYNWWDAIGGPGGEGLGNGDSVSANVLYDPWLTENQAKTVSDGIAYFGSTIPLKPGWNTLSVPLKLKDNVDSAKSANTMAEIVGLGDFLISSDTAKNWEIAYQYNPAKTRWDNIGNIKPDIELVPGRGYYIKILGTETVDFPVLYSGELDLPALELSAGWNLIGSAFGIDKTDYGIAATTDNVNGQKDVATALYSIKDKCSVVVSPSTQGQVAAWGTTVIDSNKDMIVGEAYWVFMTAPATLAGFEITPIYYLP